jgi:hypothetical protein
MQRRLLMVREYYRLQRIAPYGVPVISQQTQIKGRGKNYSLILDVIQNIDNGNIAGKADYDELLELKNQIKRYGCKLAKHAEESAIERYFYKLKDKRNKKINFNKLHMTVIRIDDDNNLIESKPCDHCIKVMKTYGIRKVTYSTKDGTLITENVDKITSTCSSGYRSIEKTIKILDDTIEKYKS